MAGRARRRARRSAPSRPARSARAVARSRTTRSCRTEARVSPSNLPMPTAVRSSSRRVRLGKFRKRPRPASRQSTRACEGPVHLRLHSAFDPIGEEHRQEDEEHHDESEQGSDDDEDSSRRWFHGAEGSAGGPEEGTRSAQRSSTLPRGVSRIAISAGAAPVPTSSSSPSARSGARIVAGSGCSARSSRSWTPPGAALRRVRALAPVNKERHQPGPETHVGVGQPPGEHLTVAQLTLAAPYFAELDPAGPSPGGPLLQVGGLRRPGDEARFGQGVEAEPTGMRRRCAAWDRG